MAKKTRTVTEYYCDVCDAMCYESDMFIKVSTSKLDMSGGVAFIRGRLTFDGLTDSIVCKACQYEYLTKYLRTIEPDVKY